MTEHGLPWTRVGEDWVARIDDLGVLATITPDDDVAWEGGYGPHYVSATVGAKQAYCGTEVVGETAAVFEMVEAVIAAEAKVQMERGNAVLALLGYGADGQRSRF